LRREAHATRYLLKRSRQFKPVKPDFDAIIGTRRSVKGPNRRKAILSNARALGLNEVFVRRGTLFPQGLNQLTRKGRWVLSACWFISKRLTRGGYRGLKPSQARTLSRWIHIRHTAKLSHLKQMLRHIAVFLEGTRSFPGSDFRKKNSIRPRSNLKRR
jgi:hypothetical protein